MDKFNKFLYFYYLFYVVMKGFDSDSWIRNLPTEKSLVVNLGVDLPDINNLAKLFGKDNNNSSLNGYTQKVIEGISKYNSMFSTGLMQTGYNSLGHQQSYSNKTYSGF